ncbi:hypothetical protein NFI96_004488 [Prochilodus magdalenae]|nr:hypothetical protein NFI96_004488 [Prochilodus magdalenae]
MSPRVHLNVSGPLHCLVICLHPFVDFMFAHSDGILQQAHAPCHLVPRVSFVTGYLLGLFRNYTSHPHDFVGRLVPKPCPTPSPAPLTCRHRSLSVYTTRSTASARLCLLLTEWGDDVRPISEDEAMVIVNHQATGDVCTLMMCLQDKGTVFYRVEVRTLCRPVQFLHTRLAPPCLYGACSVHWCAVMLEQEGAVPKLSHKVGSMEWSRVSWSAEALRVPLTGTKGRSPTPEHHPHTIIPPPPNFTLGTALEKKSYVPVTAHVT